VATTLVECSNSVRISLRICLENLDDLREVICCESVTATQHCERDSPASGLALKPTLTHLENRCRFFRSEQVGDHVDSQPFLLVVKAVGWFGHRFSGSVAGLRTAMHKGGDFE
jgi:hypothetical protein